MEPQATSLSVIDLNDMLIFLGAVIVVLPIFRRLKINSVLGYLFVGALLGPSLLSVIRNQEEASLIAEFGVVFLMFTIGLELSIDRLKRLKFYVFGLGFLQVLCCGAAIIWICYRFLGIELLPAIVIGSATALSSTAFVIQLLNERGEMNTLYGQTGFAILLFQDLAVVPLLAIVPLLGQASDASWFSILGLTLLKAMLAFFIILIMGTTILRPALRIVAASRSPELFISVTLLVLLGTGWITHQAGLSMELGAFMAGLLLSDSEYRHQIEADIQPFKGLLLGLFFITVGMSIDFQYLLGHFSQIIALISGLFAIKALIIYTLCRLFALNSQTAFRTGVLLCQGGEFAFVIVHQADSFHFFPDHVTKILFIVVALSMALTPMIVWLSHRIGCYFDSKPGNRLDWLAEKTEAIDGHVIVAGFGRVGQTVCQILTNQGIQFLALDTDTARVTQGRALAMPIYYGNGSLTEVLRAVGAGRAKALVITVSDQKFTARTVTAARLSFPNLRLFVRAHNSQHVRELEHLGARSTVPETLEASLQLCVFVFKLFNYTQDTIDTCMQDLRHNLLHSGIIPEDDIDDPIED
jgi:CPA2 family monovalent cation:H+ antiporter-2